MNTPQVHLKDPFVAGILAYLVPGLGHFYQGRRFKAVVYSVCIISLYVWGLALSDWKIVQYRGGPGEPRTELLSFAAQAGVGLPGLFAINQTRRYRQSGERLVTALREPLSTPFVGKIQVQDGDASMNGDVTGEIQLAPTVGRFNDPVIVGKLVGQLADGREVNVSLGEGVRLGPTLQNNPRRLVEADVVREGGDLPLRIGHLSGSIRRSFWNWFAVPLSHAEDQALHGQLGKYHELALVFTMIAGLLNILAVWDAVDGPAYGYGLDMEELDSDPAKDAAAPVRESARVSGAV